MMALPLGCEFKGKSGKPPPAIWTPPHKSWWKWWWLLTLDLAGNKRRKAVWLRYPLDSSRSHVGVRSPRWARWIQSKHCPRNPGDVVERMEEWWQSLCCAAGLMVSGCLHHEHVAQRHHFDDVTPHTHTHTLHLILIFNSGCSSIQQLSHCRDLTESCCFHHRRTTSNLHSVQQSQWKGR